MKNKKTEIRSKFYKFSTLADKSAVEKLIEQLKKDYGARIVFIGAFRHNKDIYDKQDEALNKEHKAGTNKPKHFHISVVFNSEVRLSTFHNEIKKVITPDIDEYVNNGGYICKHQQSNRGQKTYLLGMGNMVDYWLHRGIENQHKTPYTEDEVKNGALFFGYKWDDYLRYRKTFDRTENQKTTDYEKDDWTKTDKVLADVRLGKLKPEDIEKSDGAFYQKHLREIKNMKNEFVKSLKTPETQTTFYIFGNRGGIGKSLFSNLLSKALSNNSSFEIQDERVAFDNYMGEESIVWNDIRHQDIKDMGVKKALNLFDTFKKTGAVNIKGSYILLKNKYWVLNGIKDIYDLITFKKKTINEYGYDDWVDDDEAISQFVRRITPIEVEYDYQNHHLNIYLYQPKPDLSNYDKKLWKTYDVVITSAKKQPELYKLYNLITADIVNNHWDFDNLGWKNI